ncbi:MAG: class I SAM-dependent methyltransferase [Parachlamydia sp.]|jgi:23S rRNA (cytosine1962-C5)-methyltransferase|nr:class I SAM-dependent methyltransferase [Parachlamydia sp.]
MNSYSLLDSGSAQKLERFGQYVLARPCSQAVWSQSLSSGDWNRTHALFSREGENNWSGLNKLPEKWVIEVAGIKFKISPTDFGHLGIFPEQKPFWEWIQTALGPYNKPRVLNLFAYSGGSTLAAAKAGASVCHLDASKGMVAWARENADLNDLKQAPIRWIVEDVKKFIQREKKRGSRYEAIILDPPTFGRGAKGELFKIEEEIVSLLKDCRELLSNQPLFILFSCHTPGFTPITMHHLISQAMEGLSGFVDSGEMVLTGEKNSLPVPSGTYARWVAQL